MLHLYDDAIANDLSRCINPDRANNIVKLSDEEALMGLVAQMQNDKIQFPLVCLTRGENIEIDSSRTNFTAMKKGIPAVFDDEEHLVYYEKAMPIKLGYDITVLTTNTVDMDEILKELIFKYTETYFLTMELPYESKRKIRFGIQVDPTAIKRSSTAADYIKTGKLHQSILPLVVEGAVLLSYTPRRIMRTAISTGEVNLK